MSRPIVSYGELDLDYGGGASAQASSSPARPQHPVAAVTSYLDGPPPLGLPSSTKGKRKRVAKDDPMHYSEPLPPSAVRKEKQRQRHEAYQAKKQAFAPQPPNRQHHNGRKPYTPGKGDKIDVNAPAHRDDPSAEASRLLTTAQDDVHRSDVEEEDGDDDEEDDAEGWGEMHDDGQAYLDDDGTDDEPRETDAQGQALPTVDWQALNGASSSGGSGGRPLTHAEIWDDSALVNAWQAAEDEYKRFHAKRSEAIKAASSTAAAGTAESPLWHHAPSTDSKAAQEAREMSRKHVEWKRRMGGTSKAVFTVPPSSATSTVQTGPSSAQAKSNTSSATSSKPSEPTRKGLKGTVPPSSKIQGSAAWHAACATVSMTPNEIAERSFPRLATALGAGSALAGASTSSSNDALPTSSGTGTTSPTAETSRTQEALQNLAMSWYWAGYYQAQALHLVQQGDVDNDEVQRVAKPDLKE